MSAATYSFKGTADMSQHNQQIEKAKQEITKYKNEVDKAQRSTQKLDGTKLTGAYNSQKRLQLTVKNTTNILNGLQGNMMGALAKFGPYAAGAAAAIGVAFKATQAIMKQSDEWTDKFKGSMEGAAGAAGQLGYQIGKMDFTGLISNMQTAWNAAKNLYDAMDALGTFNIINDDRIKQVEMELEQLRTRGRKGEDVSKLIKEKEAELERVMKDAIPRIQKTKEAAMAAALNWDDLRGNNYGWGSGAGRMEALWDQMIGYKLLDSGELERRIKDTQEKIDEMAGGMTNAMVVSMPSAWREGYTSLTKELHALELATKITDDQIKAVNEQKQAVRDINNRLARTERLDLKYTDYTPKGGSSKIDKKDPVAGSLAYIDKQIKDLKDRLQNEVLTIPARVEIENEIKDLENQKTMIELQVAIEGNTDLNKAFGNLLDGVLQSGTVEDFTNNLVKLIDDTLQANTIAPSFLLPSAEMQASAKEAMSDLGKIIEEEYTKICKKIQERNQEMADSFSGLGSIFSSLGEVIGTESTNWATALGDMLSIIGEVIGKLVSLASANGVASAMELPFPANLAAVATVLAGIASAVSTIRGYSTEKYASGGIIEGSGSRIGDMHLARVNPGEMILNNRQQANLFRMMNNSAPAGSVGGSVTFHISGTDLVGVLDNQNRKTKRVR